MTRRRTRSRHRRRSAITPSIVLLIGGALMAVVGIVFLIIKRPGLSHTMSVALAKSLGGTDYSEQDSNKVMLLSCLNISGSADKKQEKETNAAHVREMAKTVSEMANKTINTRVRLFADVPQLIHTANSDPGTLRRVLKHHYIDVPAPRTWGTDLARALSESRADYQEFVQHAPGALGVYDISTDGAAENVPGQGDEMKDLHQIARQLARDRVLIFVHGIRPKDRLREDTLHQLEPLVKAGKLFHCNETDYTYVMQRFKERLKKELGIKP